MKHTRPKGAIALLFATIILFFLIFFVGILGLMYVELMKAKTKNALQNYQLSGQPLTSAAIKTAVNKAIPGCTLTSVTTFTSTNITAAVTCGVKLPFIDVSPTFTIKQTRS